MEFLTLLYHIYLDPWWVGVIFVLSMAFLHVVDQGTGGGYTAGYFWATVVWIVMFVFFRANVQLMIAFGDAMSAMQR